MTFRVPVFAVYLAPERSRVGDPVVWEGAGKRWFAGFILAELGDLVMTDAFSVSPCFEVQMHEISDLATNPDFEPYAGGSHPIAVGDAVLHNIPPRLIRAIERQVTIPKIRA